jgi:hypothetical protein
VPNPSVQHEPGRRVHACLFPRSLAGPPGSDPAASGDPARLFCPPPTPPSPCALTWLSRPGSLPWPEGPWRLCPRGGRG